MSEYKLKEIFAPQLSGQPYGQNLKEQFDAINANFKLLANRDFVKGDKGNSMRAILDPIYDNGLTPVGSQVVEALLADALGPQTWASYKGGWDGISPKTIDNINNWTKNNNITSLLPTKVDEKDVSFIDNVVNLSLIRIQTFDPSETNPIYTDVAFANNFVLRDNRFVGAALSESDLTHYDEKIDVSGTVALTVIGNDNYATTVLHDFPTLYYKQDAFRWKIGGQETGIIAQGPSGSNGKDGTIYMVKVSDEHPEGDDSKHDWCKIVAVWDRIGSDWKPNTEDPSPVSPVTDYIKEGDTCVAFLNETTEESETTSNKIYITTVVSSNDVLYAICDSTQQIQFEAGLDIVEKFMNGLPYNSGQSQPAETDWIGLHVQDSQSNNDGQPFYQHMIHSESLAGNQEAGKLGDLIIEPMNRKDEVGPATDPTARLNLKYNKIRLGFDDVDDFGSDVRDVRDSQIIASLYSTYTDGSDNYWDRSRLTISKNSYWDGAVTLKSITNISHDWNGENVKQIDPDAEVSHALNIGSEYLTISKDGNWDSDSTAALLCIYTASNVVSISAHKRLEWRNNSSSRNYIPINIGCSTLNVNSTYFTTDGNNMVASMSDVYFGSQSMSRDSYGYLTSCRLHASSVYDGSSNRIPYVELINSQMFIEHSNEINGYNLRTESGKETWGGNILLNFSATPSDPTMAGRLPKSNGTPWFTKYPGKVQIGSAERLSGFEVYGKSTFRNDVKIVEPEINTTLGGTHTLEYSINGSASSVSPTGNIGYKFVGYDSHVSVIPTLSINGKPGDANRVAIGSSANAADLKVYGDIESSGLGGGLKKVDIGTVGSDQTTGLVDRTIDCSSYVKQGNVLELTAHSWEQSGDDDTIVRLTNIPQDKLYFLACNVQYHNTSSAYGADFTLYINGVKIFADDRVAGSGTGWRVYLFVIMHSSRHGMKYWRIGG